MDNRNMAKTMLNDEKLKEQADKVVRYCWEKVKPLVIRDIMITGRVNWESVFKEAGL